MTSEQIVPDFNDPSVMRFRDGSAMRFTERDRPPRGYGCTIEGCKCQPHVEHARVDWKQLEAGVRPMRLRVLTLPAEIHADQPPSKPFVVVIDRFTAHQAAYAIKQEIIKATGARGVIVFDEEVEIGD